ncbi:nicotinamide-nucleotide amidase [Lachnospiraceae bacterium NK3A20]|nr:nicotinamide-nucleotide amidase [Lachnospiraceae bacterium NK3A20]
MDESIAGTLVQLLLQRNMTLSTCESCTGGLLASKLTEVPGVSAVYAGGFVTYTAETKHKFAGVSNKLLTEVGTVAKKTAKQMAQGTADRAGTDCALSITGNAGPDPSEDKPVGLVYIGCTIDDKTVAKKFLFTGDRQAIREQAANAAMELLLDRLLDKETKRLSQKDKTEIEMEELPDAAASSLEKWL